MKTEWQFRFETRDFVFDKERKFRGIFGKPTGDVPSPEIEGREFNVRIAPSDDAPPDGVEQVGSLFVTLPWPPEDAEPLAYTVAMSFAEDISFRFGDFRVQYGFVGWKRIPENDEEAESIGDKPYSARIHLEEVVAAPSTEGQDFSATIAPSRLALMAQFNETSRDTSPARRFLGFFRILESVSYGESGNPSLRSALLANDNLRRYLNEIYPETSFSDFVSDIVRCRHQCAHLKLERGFGYIPLDPALKEDVGRLLPRVEMIARRCVDNA